MSDLTRQVLVLSGHVAMNVRLCDAMSPYARVDCVATEHDLLQRLAQPVHLIVIHGAPPFNDVRLPARVRHTLRDPAVPIVVITNSREPAWQMGRALIASGGVEDVIFTDTERVDALVAAWSLDSDRCRQKVEALRLAHESAPETLHPFLEDLLLRDTADLSVSRWAATKAEGSRFSLHRELAKVGVAPSTVVDIARVLNIVTRVLVRGGSRLKGRWTTLPDVRAARRLLSRTLGMSPRDVTHLAQEAGVEAVRARTREAVRDMLGTTAADPTAPADPRTRR